ncbi:MAG: hypothetical protein Q4G22_15435 [Paracoccus sp. (in: a-proteobacteria)]|uniref:hypothetical protein n=1 Tax=Paracoccus sp. TaxID=267 RepID=UPI0026DF0D5C|nr:hypothetical protein [Paracoccus sp. (in: a-proteobacteria)]MDO5633204.1 hypothetical protein [Paracoccus sp. (in: a-proteobacteria)]
MSALLIQTAPGAFAQAGAAERLRAEEEQRCVWRCLADSPGAHSQQYQSCVERLCQAPPQAPAARQSTPRQPSAPGWSNHRTSGGGGHSAEIGAGGRKLSVMCSRGGQVVLGLAGFGGRVDAMVLTIDRRAYRSPAITRGGIHYAQASLAVLQALMAGRQVQASAAGTRVTFPLGGSGAAIRTALTGCGLSLR